MPGRTRIQRVDPPISTVSSAYLYAADRPPPRYGLSMLTTAMTPPTMSITTQAPYWLSGIGAAVLTYGVCAWRHRQRLADLFRRMHRIDRARQTAEQLALQARKQIEQLQKEITALAPCARRGAVATQACRGHGRGQPGIRT